MVHCLWAENFLERLPADPIAIVGLSCILNVGYTGVRANKTAHKMPSIVIVANSMGNRGMTCICSLDSYAAINNTKIYRVSNKKATQAFGSCSRTRVPILFKLTMDIV